jgi:hypothetical protein
VRVGGGRRLLITVGVAEVIVSVALLLIASTRSELPAWGGPVDGVLAFAVVATAASIWWVAPKIRSASSLSIGHAAAATIPALEIAAVWWLRDQLDLNILLPGLAWRTFIVLYTLPAAIDAWRSSLA